MLMANAERNQWKKISLSEVLLDVHTPESFLVTLSVLMYLLQWLGC